jgi:hypothetical protein
MIAVGCVPSSSRVWLILSAVGCREFLFEGYFPFVRNSEWKRHVEDMILSLSRFVNRLLVEHLLLHHPATQNIVLALQQLL